MKNFGEERPPKPFTTPSRFIWDVSLEQASVGIVGFIFAVTGPTAIMLAVGTRAGILESEMASWLFGAFFVNGLISLAMCWLYRQPLVFLWTIPGIVLIGPALNHLSFSEVLGAYYIAGAAMLVLGLSGSVRHLMKAIPVPIVMGMIAGVFLQFGLDWINALVKEPSIAVPMTAAFFVAAAMPRLANRIPPLIFTMAIGCLAITFFGENPNIENLPFAIAEPIIYQPSFSWAGIIELVIPLMVTVLAAQNSQGISVLTAAGHSPPINLITTICGFGSLITAIVGSVSSCLTGPTNAILAGSGADQKGQYTAAIIACIGVMTFGLLSPLFTALILGTPKAFIATLAGLALLNVLKGSFTMAFSENFTLGALISFIVTVSDFNLFNIGSPFWGLLLGFIGSAALERDAFSNPSHRK